MKNDNWSFRNFCYVVAYYLIGFVSAPIILYFSYPVIDVLLKNVCSFSDQFFFCGRGFLNIVVFSLLLPFLIFFLTKRKFLILAFALVFYLGFVVGSSMVSYGLSAIQ